MSGLKMAGGSLIATSVLHSGFGLSVGSYWGGLAVVGVITGLLLAFATRHWVEFAVFKTISGAHTLSVARSGKQTADYDAFIQQVIHQIERRNQTPGISEA